MVAEEIVSLSLLEERTWVMFWCRFRLVRCDTEVHSSLEDSGASSDLLFGNGRQECACYFEG